jgi:hypothetical protein
LRLPLDVAQAVKACGTQQVRIVALVQSICQILCQVPMQIHQLAQLNIATMRESLESPLMADFVDNLDRINALAESADGFVWRLQTDAGDATQVRPLGAQTLVNLSVWRDVASLKDYVYKTAHAQIMRRRQEWFDRMDEASLVLWWVPVGHRPGIDEAVDKLRLLRSVGPSAQAFNFKNSLYLFGYFQSEKYFADNKNSIVNELNPPVPTKNIFLEMKDKIVNSNSISLGVRLHETMPQDISYKVGGITPFDFYKNARFPNSGRSCAVYFYIFV